MPEVVEVPVSDLLLDGDNARLANPQTNQPDTALALTRQQGSKLVNLAEDIVTNGIDPTSLTVIVATDDKKKRYRVLEGNRRVLALKALDTPSLVTPALNSKDRARLNKLAEAYAASPIAQIPCLLMERAEDADHWVELRHTGANEGVGLVEWGAEEKDRYQARHGRRSAALQVIDFVAKHGALSDAASGSQVKILTSLKRLLNTPEVRERLGLEKIDDVLYTRYPAEEVAKGLSRIVDDLVTQEIRVKDIYHAEDRRKYINTLDEDSLPDPSTQLEAAQSLDNLTEGTPTTPPPKKKPRRRKPTKEARQTLIPKECNLDIDQPRLNGIYVELDQLSLEVYPNAVSVLVRVFLELSVDHYANAKRILTEEERRNQPLAKKLKTVAGALRSKGVIDGPLEAAIKKVADGSRLLAPGTVTFNQYVHNAYVHPSPADLRGAWDELQPFFEALWPTTK